MDDDEDKAAMAPEVKTFTCLVCGARYVFKDHHGCLDRDRTKRLRQEAERIAAKAPSPDLIRVFTPAP